MVVLEQITFANKSLTLFPNDTFCVHDFLNIFKEYLNSLKCAEKRAIAEILLNICEDCTKMASLPHGAFAACKLRERYQDREMLIARMKSAKERNEAKNENTNKKLTEYSPAKYNGKMMNSIWGFYNRYSPHNIKGNEYDLDTNKEIMQQQMAVASYVIAEELAMTLRSGKEWQFMEKK